MNIIALHPEGIRRGVHAASKIRVGELEEDHPWMRAVMRPLGGMYVPCEFGEIAERWRSECVFDRLAETIEENEPTLPPLHLDDSPGGVRRDLEPLGVFQPLYDGQVNIPNVFCVGYGLGLRGGVKPTRRAGSGSGRPVGFDAPRPRRHGLRWRQASEPGYDRLGLACPKEWSRTWQFNLRLTMHSGYFICLIATPSLNNSTIRSICTMMEN